MFQSVEGEEETGEEENKQTNKQKETETHTHTHINREEIKRIPTTAEARTRARSRKKTTSIFNLYGIGIKRAADFCVKFAADQDVDVDLWAKN